MNLLRYLVLIIYFMLPVFAIARNDSLPIVQRILNYPVNRDDYVLKGRRMLLDRFEQMDWVTVKQIMDYFEKEIDQSDYMSLWPGEKMLLYYWTRQYDQLLEYVTTAPIVDQGQYEYSPLDPRLGEVFTKWSVNDFDILNDWIDESAKSAEEKAFLKLVLIKLLSNDLLPNISQEQINHQADAFIEQFPYSKYIDFTRKNISFKTEWSNWGFGFGFGGGYTLHNNDYLNPKGGLIMDLTIRYKRCMFDMILLGSFGKLKQDIPDTEWFKGDNAAPFCVGLVLGYDVLNLHKFRLTPYAGVSFNNATPDDELRDEYPSLKDVRLEGFSAIMGFKFDWKFLTTQNSYYRYSPATIYALNLNVSYLPGTFNKAGQIYSGNMLFVTLGLSFDWYKIKRAN